MGALRLTGVTEAESQDLLPFLQAHASSPNYTVSFGWKPGDFVLSRPGQLVGSSQLLTGVWGPGARQRTNYLRFHMARLRGKLEDNPARPRHLLTEPGMGYRYQP